MSDIERVVAEKGETFECYDCDGKIVVPVDVVVGEIVTCPDCGLQFEVKEVGSKVTLEEFQLVGEDWGE